MLVARLDIAPGEICIKTDGLFLAVAAFARTAVDAVFMSKKVGLCDESALSVKRRRAEL